MGYRGVTATIPLGDSGLLTDATPGQIPSNALIRANNVQFNVGSIEKMSGAKKYNASALSSGIVALHDWHPETHLQRLIAVTDDGFIYRDTGDKLFSGGTALNSTALTGVSPKDMFVEGGAETAGNNKKLFYFSEFNQVQVMDGDNASFADISSAATDWSTNNYPTFGIVHRNRLWAGGNKNAPARIYASNTGDHENFTSSILTINIFPGEGGRLIGAYVFKGRLFVFKEGGFVYYLEDSDTTSSNWFFRKLSSGFGLASPHAIVQAMDDLILGNTTGSYTSMTAAESLGDIESADILRNSQTEDYIKSLLSRNGIEFQHSLYYEEKKQIFFTGRHGYRTYNNFMVVMDVSRANNLRISTSDAFEPDCLALRKDVNGIPRPIYGERNGFVYLMDQEDRLVDATAYTGEFKTAHTDFRQLDPTLAGQMKIFDHIALSFVPQGDWNASVEVYIDGILSETINFKQTVFDDGLGAFTLGTDPLGREEAQTIVKPLHGTGRSISYHVKQSGSNQNFRISAITTMFRPAGHNQTRVS